MAGLEDLGLWESLARGLNAVANEALHCPQGRSLSFKTFLVWVLISIYQGKPPAAPARGLSAFSPLLSPPARSRKRAVASAVSGRSRWSRKRVSRQRVSRPLRKQGGLVCFLTDECLLKTDPF